MGGASRSSSPGTTTRIRLTGSIGTDAERTQGTRRETRGNTDPRNDTGVSTRGETDGRDGTGKTERR